MYYYFSGCWCVLVLSAGRLSVEFVDAIRGGESKAGGAGCSLDFWRLRRA